MSQVVYLLDDDSKLQRMRMVLDSFKIKYDSICFAEFEYYDEYDISLSIGEKSARLEKLLPDIGMSLKAITVPVGTVIMSSGIYKIRIQKAEILSNSFDELYKRSSNFYAPILLGTSFDGNVFIKDLHSLPNLLIGGIPGSGKSVLLHSIIASLIRCNAKLYLIDPKMVEFNIYENVKQVSRIETALPGVYDVIENVTCIMNSRFEKLSNKKCRNVFEYNKIPKARKMRPVVIVIDEWADIVLQDKNIQEKLCVVAQKGRAAGISVVLATQRPSAKVISGLIKANFSGRISLRVSSKLESRIILDMNGAENIKSVGSGMYLDHKTHEPIYFRAPFIEDPRSLIDDDNVSVGFWDRILNWL